MYKIAATILAISLISLCCSCGDMLESHPYDTNVSGERNINEKSIKNIEKTLKDSHTVRFAFISDTQRWYDETELAVNALNARDDIDFVLHGGDLSDFGITDEFTWQRDILSKLKVPYVCILGNHDCLGNGRYVFNLIFGKDNFAFTAGNIRFVCLNTNALEFDYSKSIPDFDFMKKEIENFPKEATKTIMVMHAKPGSDVFNNNVKEPFGYYVKMFPSVQFCLNGHNHSFEVEDIYHDGIKYYQCPNIEKRAYLVFTVYDGGFDYEMVKF